MTESPTSPEPGSRSGFVSIVGRPNVGKSTLINSIVGSKIAISSSRPQTTRHAIRGIANRPWGQIIFIDTPGLHKPKTLLGKRLNQIVHRTMTEVDAALLVLDASDQFGAGDEMVATHLKRAGVPTIVAINKADAVLPPDLLRQIDSAKVFDPQWEVLTTSAVKGTGVEDVVEALGRLMPEGQPLYPADILSDQPEAVLVAELIREKVLQKTRQEVPHSVAVQVDEMQPREGAELVDVYASIYVERDSQKGIVIGKGGKMLRAIGSDARGEIEALLGSQIFLDLRVKVEPHWQSDDRALQRLGYL